jgi:hypothetical protein
MSGDQPEISSTLANPVVAIVYAAAQEVLLVDQSLDVVEKLIDGSKDLLLQRWFKFQEGTVVSIFVS